MYNYPQFQSYQPNYQVNSQQMDSIPVPNEAVARNYPVSFGTTIRFRDENAPYIYIKTMGLSQYEPPVFEKFRLVKEEAEPSQNVPQKTIADTVNPKEDNSLYEAIRGDLDKLKKEVSKLKKEIKAINKSDVSDEAAELSEDEEDV